MPTSVACGDIAECVQPPAMPAETVIKQKKIKDLSSSRPGTARLPHGFEI
jgi:hypothetical protein